jgi:hypothetical protein
MAITLGVLTSGAPLVAGAIATAVVLIAFLSTVRQAVPMLALAGLAAVAVSYTQATQGGVTTTAKYLADTVLLVGVLLLVRLRGRLTPRLSRTAGLVLLFMLASAIAGVLGGGSLRLAVLGNWQDARWLGAIGIGVAIADALEPSQRRRWAFRWLLVLNGLGAFVSLYQILAHDYTTTRLGFPEVSGLFGQTTANALAATILLIFVLTDGRSRSSSMSKREMALAIGVGFLDLLLSTRFKPGLALVAVAMFVYLRRIGLRPLALASIGAAIPVMVTLGLAWVTAPGHAQSGSETIANIIGHATPRVQFMNGAEQLASKHFPLGGGSGTYGSALSQSRESEAFADAGLAGQYGFRAQGPQFSSDNFVAHVLGERGYAGLIAWLISLAALIYFALVSTPSSFVPGVAIAAASLTSVVPVFRDGAAILLLFIPATLYLWGSAHAGSERSKPLP